MEMTRDFQQMMDERKQKKRRKKRRRRMRRFILLLIVVGVFVYPRISYGGIQNIDAQDIADGARSVGVHIAESLPDIRVWIADKLNYIAQFM
ncbi:MAG: hypothetical protein SPI65_04010 [Peptoniphilus sp.]|nr:hypothetical protein [Peptoniphilus sp.]MDD7363626.1 hypothetical protein [Bacillota bacterium]MDY6044729.1 hypothetical protein [Peptoniphilus sp.]